MRYFLHSLRFALTKISYFFLNFRHQMESSLAPHVAMFPAPGMGHLIPMAELAKRLADHHGLSITFITLPEPNATAQRAVLDSLRPKSIISSLSLPPADLSDLPPRSQEATLLSAASARSVPAVSSVLRRLEKSRNLVAFIADIFSAGALDAANEVGIPGYIFFPSNFLTLSLILHLPELDREFPCEFRDLPGPVKLPGCVPIPGKDILHPLQDKMDEAYSWLLRLANKYRDARGILVNTFDEFEPEAAKVLTRVEEGRPPVYSVGPLIRTGCDGPTGPCVQWLDKQPRGSVLYVSFGSRGSLSSEQIEELALGLEMSGQRFLWVVRTPSELVEFLPEGFIGRTKNVGLVVSTWAPQIEVLGHGSVGGFLTHCGWNSTLESVVNGVPMIAWPLYAEQKQNAVMLIKDTKIALKVNFGEDGVTRREEISEVARELMVGERGRRVRYKVRQLQEAGAKALEMAGRSYKSLADVAKKWKEG